MEAALQQSSITIGQVAATSSSTDQDQSTPLKDFEWRELPFSSISNSLERESEAGDGMASLPASTGSSGYLGSSSGSSLLQAVFNLLPGTPYTNPRHAPSVVESQVRDIPSDHERVSTSGVKWLDRLATAAVTHRLVDVFFSSYNASYPVLHEGSFRTKYRDPSLLHPTLNDRLTYYMVLAIGHWLLSHSDEADTSPYYHAARSSISVQMLESGSIEAVQALALLGNYLQKRDRPNTGYHYMGIALRMALGLGLHRELALSDPTITDFVRQRRRQVWWVLFCFDSGFSITTGRPLMVSDASSDVLIPGNCEDTDAEYSASPLQILSCPTMSSAVIAQAALAVIANRIYINLSTNNHNSHALDIQTVSTLDDELSAWRSDLPPYFFSDAVPAWFLVPREVVMWKEQNIRTMLWRGSERSRLSDHDRLHATARFQEFATQSIRSICTFCEEKAEVLHQGAIWYATYFLFQATLALDIFHLRHRDIYDPVKGEASWNACISQAKDCLGKLGRINSAAQRCLSVLHRIHDHLTLPAHASALATTPMMSEMNEPGSQAPLHFDNEWILSADPSLFMFLDDISMPTLLDGSSGFSATQEQIDFEYTSSNAHDSRGPA